MTASAASKRRWKHCQFNFKTRRIRLQMILCREAARERRRPRRQQFYLLLTNYRHRIAPPQRCATGGYDQPHIQVLREADFDFIFFIVKSASPPGLVALSFHFSGLHAAPRRSPGAIPLRPLRGIDCANRNTCGALNDARIEIVKRRGGYAAKQHGVGLTQ
jgi:hypothetical protein